jgi:hypothetical protein
MLFLQVKQKSSEIKQDSLYLSKHLYEIGIRLNLQPDEVRFHMERLIPIDSITDKQSFMDDFQEWDRYW